MLLVAMQPSVVRLNLATALTAIGIGIGGLVAIRSAEEKAS